MDLLLGRTRKTNFGNNESLRIPKIFSRQEMQIVPPLRLIGRFIPEACGLATGQLGGDRSVPEGRLEQSNSWGAAGTECLQGELFVQPFGQVPPGSSNHTAAADYF